MKSYGSGNMYVCREILIGLVKAGVLKQGQANRYFKEKFDVPLFMPKRKKVKP